MQDMHEYKKIILKSKRYVCEIYESYQQLPAPVSRNMVKRASA